MPSDAATAAAPAASHLPLAGRRALVTAASSGIGRATAQVLREHGAEVFITGTSERAAGAAAGLGAAGHALADFTDPAAPAAATQRAIDALGGLDVLVVNTGGPRPGPFAGLTDEDWLAAYHLILGSAIGLTRAALPALTESGSGRVVYLTSTAGVVKPLPGLHLSNVMRAAVAGLARSLVAEYGPRGVTFNVIAPGPIDTGRHEQIVAAQATARGVDAEAIAAQERERIPMRRIGTPQEVGALAAYLASAAAGFITGAVHVIDGGMTTA